MGQSRILIRVLFAAFVVATFSAFFVAQRVKRSPPVIEKVRFVNKHFSPTGNGVRDRAGISFRLKRTDTVDVEIVNRVGDVIRTLASARDLCGPCTHRFRWDGRREGGDVAADGEYFLRVTLRERARSITSPRKLFLDTTAPTPTVRSVIPSAISPDGDGRAESARVLIEAPTHRPPELIVYRTGRRRAVEVARFRGRAGSNVARWDGRTRGGRRAPPGNYLIAVRVRDIAGNLGSAPRRLPPRRDETAGNAGVVVRYIAARPPTAPVRAGERVSFRIDTDRRRYRWSIRRVGAGTTARSGTSGARGRTGLLARAPGRTGLYLLELRAGRHSYSTPFAVRAPSRPNVLVVLPAISWHGRNLYDSTEDGWGETLGTTGVASLRRPFAGGGLPEDFTSTVQPLMELLDRQDLTYDLTTDLAMAREEGPAPAGYAGVLFAGDQQWVPSAIARRLREYVTNGGRVAWFGTGGFRRDVRLAPRSLRDPGRRQARNPFGERVSVTDLEPPAPLLLLSDRIGFFSGVGGTFGRIEESEELPPGARLLAGAGREVERPALAVYRLDRGVVARMGAAGLAAQLDTDPATERMILRLWDLLSQ